MTDELKASVLRTAENLGRLVRDRELAPIFATELQEAALKRHAA